MITKVRYQVRIYDGGKVVESKILDTYREACVWAGVKERANVGASHITVYKENRHCEF